MGGALTAPVAALGSCFGTCVATGCCRLAFLGSVGSGRGAACLLWWLQAAAASLALLGAFGGPGAQLSGPCRYLDGLLGAVGICACRSEAECWSQQLVYRAGAAAAAVFLFLLVLCASGCAAGAASSLPVLKFMALLGLFAASLFVPNGIFDGFGLVASLLACPFFVVQAVQLVDVMHTWNAAWLQKSQVARRDAPGSRRQLLWLGGLLAASLCFLASAAGMTWHLCLAYPAGPARALTLGALAASLLLLILSITEWCKHGALLPSAAVVAFVQWLAWQALASSGWASGRGTGGAGLPPAWVTLALGAACLLSLVCLQTGVGGASAPPAEALELTRPRASEVAVAEEAGEAPAVSRAGAQSAYRFGAQCAAHAAGAAYTTRALAPSTGALPAAVCIAALAASLLLYGWSLVAPSVLTGRDFGF